MLVGDIPVRNAGFYPNKLAIIEENARFTFAEFNERVNRLGNAIIGLGLIKGDRIAVLNHNCYQYLELYFASAKIGTPIVPLNYRFTANELLYILNDSGAKIIFFGKEYLSTVGILIKESPLAEHYVCIDKSFPGVKNYEEIISMSSATDPLLPIDEEDIVILGYTGGTTGKPKGVMTTHRNIITSCYNNVIERALNPNAIFLNVPPLFHAGGANSMFAFSFIGATNMVINSSDIEIILKTIEEYMITHLVLVPTMIQSLLEHPNIEAYNLLSLKAIFYGTAPISVESLKKAMELLKCDFSQIYGMTETFVPISILKPEDHLVEGSAEDYQRMSSAGREVMGVQVKIVKEDGREVSTGQIGEIVVKGKNVMKGYWNQPELTKEVLIDGWLHTGDMGRMDEYRYLYIVDRKKDMIISGGENIYAKEVEDVLSTHPAVVQAVVIGIPDNKWGESVKAFVIKKKGTEVSEEDLIGFCKTRLASYKKPKFVEFVGDFPKSTAGKVLKRELREQYWKGRNRKI